MEQQKLIMNTEATKFEFPFDTGIARELESKIDPCSFSTIKRYFFSATSEINQVVIVQESYKLEEVAAFFVAPDSSTTVLEQMLRAGVFKYGVPTILGVRPEWQPFATAFDTIPFDLMVYALYNPPIYIIKLTKEFWR